MDDKRLDGPVSRLVRQTIEAGTVDEAVDLMNHLRQEALRLDRHLADPRHQWNRVS